MPNKASHSSRRRLTILSEISPTYGRAHSRVLPFVLWVLLLAWIVRITVFVRRRVDTEFAEVDLLAGIQILVVLVVLITVLLGARAFLIWSKTAGTSVRALFFYYILSALSALWSPLPEYSLYRAFEFMILFMGVLVALSYAPNFVKAERIVLIVSLISITLTLYAKFINIGFSTSLDAWHTTAYSASAAMIFCYCLGEYFQTDKNRKKRLRWVGFVALAALVLGTSAGSNVAASFGVLIVAFLRRNTALIFIGCILLLVMLPVFLFGDIDDSAVRAVLFPGKTEAQIYSMRGRVALWNILFNLFLDSPVFGHGFAVLSTGRGRVLPSNPHNSLFSVLLGTGILGMLTVIFYFLRLRQEFYKTTVKRLPGAVGCTAAICTGLVNSLSTPFVLEQWEEASFVFAAMTAFSILFVYLPYKSKEKEKKGKLSDSGPMRNCD